MIGKIIGNYQILEEVGRGPNGVVYQAIDQARGQRVALKAINTEWAHQSAFNQNLRALAAALTALQHTRLAAFYHVLHQNDGIYLVSELVNGQSLTQALQQSSALPPEQSVTLAIQTLAALNHAHKAGLVHGGVKPGNLLLTAKDQLKVTDLGLAQALGEASFREGRGPGVLNYCAPEQVRGAALDARTDIYALGAVLFEMLTGVPPFRRANDAALCKAHLEEAVPSPRNYFPLIPALLEQAILRALAKDPAARFQSADEFRQALLKWASTRATNPAAVVAPSTPAKAGPSAGKAAPLSALQSDKSAPAAKSPVLPVPPMRSPQAESANPAASQAPAPARRQANPASAVHNQAVVDLNAQAAKRSLWKPLAAVAGLAALLGISYAFVRVGRGTPASQQAPLAVQLSPTPAPSSTVASAPVAAVTPAALTTPSITPTPTITAKAAPVKPPIVKPKPAPPARKPAPTAVVKAKPTPTPVVTKKNPYATPTPASKKEKKEKKGVGGFLKGVLGGESKEKKQKKP